MHKHCQGLWVLRVGHYRSRLTTHDRLAPYWFEIKLLVIPYIMKVKVKDTLNFRSLDGVATQLLNAVGSSLIVQLTPSPSTFNFSPRWSTLLAPGISATPPPKWRLSTLPIHCIFSSISSWSCSNYVFILTCRFSNPVNDTLNCVLSCARMWRPTGRSPM